LDSLQNARRGALVAVAAFVGTTRLIDNVLL
jgi:pantothenate synthetase